MMPPNEASRTRQGLFTDLPRETVRKGYEQQSERGFGRYTERKMDRKATPWRPVRLCWERLRDFSDSLRREILGNPYSARRIVMREDQGKGPLHALIGEVGNTTCSRV